MHMSSSLIYAQIFCEYRMGNTSFPDFGLSASNQIGNEHLITSRNLLCGHGYTIPAVEQQARTPAVHRRLHHSRPKPRSCSSLLAAPSTITPSPSLVELPLLTCFALGPFPTKRSSSVMATALRMERHSIPTITSVLLRYCFLPGFASLSHPVNRAYVVRIEPRLPSPDTTADAAATPTSP